jgi:hypothetical protein
LICAAICDLVTASVPGEHLLSHAFTFPVLDTAAATCLTTRMTLRLLVVLSAVARATLLTAMTTVIAPGENPIFRLMMLHLNVAVSSRLHGIV